ncbi:MAG: hypothetical protein JWP09_593 [Candidatus Taylorbacteria bacterium]|nr:hypothetical protein [Candidatus Taylorbacteria bacterium]
MSIYKSRTLTRIYSFTSPVMIFMITLLSVGGVLILPKTTDADAISIGSCLTLNTPNATYVLTQNIGTAGTCLLITADGIIIDAAGYSITGSIHAGGQSEGERGHSFTLKNALVYGPIESDGFTSSSPGVNGTDGGDIVIQNSAVNDNIEASGGSGANGAASSGLGVAGGSGGNGGNGGSIRLIHTDALGVGIYLTGGNGGDGAQGGYGDAGTNGQNGSGGDSCLSGNTVGDGGAGNSGGNGSNGQDGGAGGNGGNAGNGGHFYLSQGTNYGSSFGMSHFEAGSAGSGASGGTGGAGGAHGGGGSGGTPCCDTNDPENVVCGNSGASGADGTDGVSGTNGANGGAGASGTVGDSNNFIDTTAPVVSITAPLDSATVSGSVDIAADASDDSATVAGLQFMISVDGGNSYSNLGSEITSSPYTISWSSGDYADGVYYLKAVARDDAGNLGENALSVTVSNTTTHPGCTDLYAINYDPSATDDDGSCLYLPTTPGTPTLTDESDTGILGDNITSSSTPTVTVSCVSDDSVTLYADGSLLVTQTCVDSIATFHPLLVSDGNYSLTAIQSNANGDSVESEALNLTIDAHTPDTPDTAPDLYVGSDTGLSDTDNITNFGSLTFEGPCTDGDIITLYNDGVVTGSPQTCAGSLFSIISDATADGVNLFKYKASTVAGKSSGFSPALSVTVDTTSPNTPSIPDLAPGSDTGVSNTDNITSNTNPTLTVSCDEAGDTVSMYDSGTGLDTSTCDGSSAVFNLSFAEGAHYLTAQQSDLAGNSSALSDSMTLTIQTTPLFVTNVTSNTPDGTYKTGDAINIQVQFNGNVILTGDSVLRFDGAQNVYASSGSITNILSYLYIVQPGYSSSDFDYDTTESLSGNIKDEAGNDVTLTLPAPGDEGSLSYNKDLVIDGVAPSTPSSAPNLDSSSDTGISSTDNITSDTTPTFTGTCTDIQVNLYVDETLNNYIGCNAGNFTITSTTLSDGVHTVTYKEVDSVGNESGASPALTVTIDTTSPQISSIASSTTTTTANISWSTPDESSNSKVSYGTVSGTYISEVNDASFNTSHSIDLSGLSSNTQYYFVAVSTDTAGSISTSTEQTFTTTASGTPDTTPPQISSATVSGNKLVVTLNEPILSNSPSLYNYLIGINTGGEYPQAVSPVVSGNTITFTLNESVISSDIITLNYANANDPHTKDLAGNDLQPVSGVTVTNTTPVPSSGGGTYNSNFTNILSSGGGSPVPNILILQTPTATSTPTVTPPSTPATNPLSSTFTFTKTAILGNTSPEIKNLQIFLNAQGYIVAKTGAGSPGKETTKFGPATKVALIKFQKDHHIKPASGYFGPVTKTFINAMLKGK